MPDEPEMRPDDPTLASQLQHVFWIGGGSGAGKSVMAHRLAAQHDLRTYATDDVMSDHARRSTPDHSPYLTRFMAMNMDERWANRSPRIMLETFHWFRGEGFGLIVEDLLALPNDRPVVVEGFRLLPHLVKPLLASPTHALWLLPTPDFRQAAFVSRGSLWAIAGKTNKPEEAQRNLLERDRMFTERLHREIDRLDLRAITVDVTMTEDDLADQVTLAFGL